MTLQLIFGSSFVRRLQNYVNSDIHCPGTTHFKGISGLRTDRLPTNLLSNCTALNPDVVFIHVGGNDITVESTPREIFCRLMNIVEVFYKAGCKRVVVGEILERGDVSKSPGLTVSNYKRQKRKLNTLLQKRLGDDFIQFRDMQYPRDFCGDGVHLSTEPKNTSSKSTGMRKYLLRIQRVLISAANACTKEV